MNEGNPIPTANPIAIVNAVSMHAALTTGVHGAGGNNVANTGTNTFTGTQTIQAAATQDAIKIAGRAGGTSSFAVTVTPLALSANRTRSEPDEDGTYALRGANTFTAAQSIDTASGVFGLSIGPSFSSILSPCLAIDGTGGVPIAIVDFRNSANGPAPVFYKSRGLTSAGRSACQSGDQLLFLTGSGRGDTADLYNKGGLIVSCGSTWTDSSSETQLDLVGTPSGSVTRATWLSIKNGIVSVPNTTEAADKDTGSIVVEGGIGVEKSVFAGSDITAVGAVYIGGNATDGSWRMTISGTSLVVQRRESGVWVTKQTMEA